QSDPEPLVRAAAALSLGRYVVLNEFEAIRTADGRVVLDALRSTFDDERETPEVRARAIEALGSSSEAWVPALIWRAYDADDARLHIGALNAMGRNSEPSWLETLYEEMESED